MGRYEIRYTGALPAMAAHLEASASSVAPNLAIKFHPLADEISGTLALNRATALLAALFGSIVGLLTIMGVYAMTSYAAAQRTREIGIRMALGAQRGNVLRTIIRDSLGAVFAGTILGMLVALGAAQAVRAMLWGVGPNDPVSFAAALSLMLLATGIAAFVPANRAVRSNPMECLRHE